MFFSVFKHMMASRGLKVSESTTREFFEILLKQLAWENANALCQDLIRPIRKTGTVQDYVKACVDASPAVVQGMAYAAAMKEEELSAYIKKTYGKGGKATSKPTCFKCGKSGHVQKQCPGNNKRDSNRRGSPPGVCPRCQKGKHWKNECKSRFHKDGTPLNGEKKEEESKN